MLYIFNLCVDDFGEPIVSLDSVVELSDDLGRFIEPII